MYMMLGITTFKELYIFASIFGTTLMVGGLLLRWIEYKYSKKEGVKE